KSGVFLVAFCARLKTYGAFFGDKNHKAFSRFCLCGHEKSGLGRPKNYQQRQKVKSDDSDHVRCAIFDFHSSFLTFFVR
ncbi:hypothetical protein, partial [Pseudomonas aeruginosa]|uniref:hypothetical protein n=1 Tax=Pseudomonas aeruginosa TaxID=287 RepID=UPI002F909D38